MSKKRYIPENTPYNYYKEGWAPDTKGNRFESRVLLNKFGPGGPTRNFINTGTIDFSKFVGRQPIVQVEQPVDNTVVAIQKPYNESKPLTNKEYVIEKNKNGNNGTITKAARPVGNQHLSTSEAEANAAKQWGADGSEASGMMALMPEALIAEGITNGLVENATNGAVHNWGELGQQSFDFQSPISQAAWGLSNPLYATLPFSTVSKLGSIKIDPRSGIRNANNVRKVQNMSLIDRPIVKTPEGRYIRMPENKDITVGDDFFSDKNKFYRVTSPDEIETLNRTEKTTIFKNSPEDIQQKVKDRQKAELRVALNKYTPEENYKYIYKFLKQPGHDHGVWGSNKGKTFYPLGDKDIGTVVIEGNGLGHKFRVGYHDNYGELVDFADDMYLSNLRHGKDNIPLALYPDDPQINASDLSWYRKIGEDTWLPMGNVLTEKPKVIQLEKRIPIKKQDRNYITTVSDFSKGDGFKEGGPTDSIYSSLINRVNTSNADFVQRINDPSRITIPAWEDPYNSVATHKLGWTTDNKGNAVVFPSVQNINGRLVDFTRPPYSKWAAYDNAVQRGDTLMMKPNEAQWYTEHYKEYAPKGNGFKFGGSLKKLNKSF